ncbi:MAG TPA: glycosyltransferase, partial [Methylomirabilota bacterium]|nr:glycosyltransferase [Methylomirabilota bacterium]
TVSIAKRLGVPVISTFHLQPENLLYNLGIRSQILADLLYRFFVRWVYKRSAAVICPSAFAESELRRFGLKVPTYIVSNGIMPRFRPGHYGRQPDLEHKFVILSVGRLARDKRHDVLIQAILSSKHRHRIQLIVAGHGPLKEQVEKLASALPVPARIGYLSEEELIRWLNTADLYVHPSEVELEGMAVLEAMACGLPVLMADARTSASKQFAISERFLFRTNDPVHLASRIDYWIEHHLELHDARTVYLEKASHYRIEQSVESLERIYSSHIHRDRRSRVRDDTRAGG